MATDLNTDMGTTENFTGFEEDQVPAPEPLAPNDDRKIEDVDQEMDSDPGNLVISEPPKSEPKSTEKSPRKRRSRASLEDSTPTRMPSTRVRGRGLAYLIAMEKGGSKKRMAQAQAQAEAQDASSTGVATNSPDKNPPVAMPEPLKEPEPAEDKEKEANSSSGLVSNSPVPSTNSRPRSAKREAVRKSYGAANISSPLIREPFKDGWKREVVYRATVDPGTKTLCDVYYYTPDKKKLRSGREVAEYLEKHESPYTVENFTFFKEPIGMAEDQEILRYAKQRRDDGGGGASGSGGEKNISKKERALKAREEELRRNLQELGEDVAAITGQAALDETLGQAEGESAVAPSAESTSPSRKKKNKPEKQLKIKLWGSKNLKSKENAEPLRKDAEEETSDEKKISPARGLPEDIQHLFSSQVPSRSVTRSAGRGLGRSAPQGLETVNGKRFVSIGNNESVRSPTTSASLTEAGETSFSTQGVKRPLQSPDQPSPRSSPKRIKAPNAPTSFCSFPSEQFVNFVSHAYQGLLHVFRYLTVQELMAAAGVCKLWRDLALHHSHWRVIRLKNSRIYDWTSFSTHLRRAGTRHLDMRKMLFVTSREDTWSNISQAASHLSEIQRIDFCKCPVELVETIARHCPRLECIDATTISSPSIRMEILSGSTQLQELKVRATSGIAIEDGLKPLINLRHLKYLSLTTVADLQASQVESLAELPCLENLEMGDCVGWTRAADYETFGRLAHLQQLRLEQGPPDKCVLNYLTSLNNLDRFSQLELVNFNMSASMEQFNLPALRRLLVIPRYSEETLADTVKHVFDALSSMTNLQHVNWVVTNEIMNSVANGKVPFVDGADETGLTLNELLELLKTKLAETQVKITPIPQYATARYNLSSNVED